MVGDYLVSKCFQEESPNSVRLLKSRDTTCASEGFDIVSLVQGVSERFRSLSGILRQSNESMNRPHVVHFRKKAEDVDDLGVGLQIAACFDQRLAEYHDIQLIGLKFVK